MRLDLYAPGVLTSVVASFFGRPRGVDIDLALIRLGYSSALAKFAATDPLIYGPEVATAVDSSSPLVIDDATSADPGLPDATIARAHFDGLRGPPYEFAIELDRSRVREDARYSLRATLRDASGHLAFMTPTRVAVTPGQPVEFRLVRAPAM
jgi:uncharacterized lipoprotein YbaY